MSVPFTQERMTLLQNLSDEAENARSIEELKAIFERVETVCKEVSDESFNDLHEDLFKSSKSGNYYLRISKEDNIISSVAMPEALVRRIKESIEKSIDISPLLKLWARFLKNEKASSVSFAQRFFNYIDMKYVRPNILIEKIKEGYSEELARELATTYQVKITKEGLVNCYKISKEVDWKYVAGEDGEAIMKPLYQKTFDPITGEVTGNGNEELCAEDRIFIPAIMGFRGDKFYCEGGRGNGQLGHQIRVGSVHRLPDWSYVDRDDRISCVKGLHVGGLDYISNYSGEIHNVFVDPMHIGAIPDDRTGAMRVLQYFVHSSMVAVNASIYHSSDYAKKTDEQWKEIKQELLKEFGALEEQNNKDKRELTAL